MRGLQELAGWLDRSALHGWIQDTAWSVPAIQTAHILAIGIVFSGAAIVALRLFGGIGGDWPPTRWSARLDRWSWGSLVLLLATGLLMIAGEPARSLLNPVFQAKMALLPVGIALSLWLAARLRSDAAGGHEKALAVATVAVWIAMISAGRWIAYYAEAAG